jgi:predicted nucleic acid-binding Zn ribbon protein
VDDSASPATADPGHPAGDRPEDHQADRPGSPDARPATGIRRRPPTGVFGLVPSAPEPATFAGDLSRFAVSDNAAPGSPWRPAASSEELATRPDLRLAPVPDPATAPPGTRPRGARPPAAGPPGIRPAPDVAAGPLVTSPPAAGSPAAGSAAADLPAADLPAADLPAADLPGAGPPVAGSPGAAPLGSRPSGASSARPGARSSPASGSPALPGPGSTAHGPGARPGPGTSGSDPDRPAGGPPPARTAAEIAADAGIGRAALDIARAASRRAPLRASRRRRRAGAEERRGGYSGPGPDARDPQAFGSMIKRMVSDRGWEETTASATVLSAWDQVVGPELASRCQPVSLRDGELTLAAESTAWAMQIRGMLPTLMTRVRAELGPGVVTHIRVHGPTAPTWSKGPLRIQGRGPRDTYG